MEKELLNHCRIMSAVIFIALLGLFYVMFKHNVPSNQSKAIKTLNLGKLEQLENQVTIK